MKILLLEDLDSFAETIREGLQSRNTQLGTVEITRIATELEFRRRLPELAKAHFDMAIFDVMVGWCAIEDLDAQDGINPPPEVEDEREGKTKWRSGVRCRRLFAEACAKNEPPITPCIFYTILKEDDLKDEIGDGTPIVTKDGQLDNLVAAILRVTAGI